MKNSLDGLPIRLDMTEEKVNLKIIQYKLYNLQHKIKTKTERR